MRKTLFTLMLCGAAFLIGCSDDINVDVKKSPMDAGKAVTFTGFNPSSGGMGTHFYIHGNNFGTDESKIHVTIGGKEAKVLGSNGTTILAQVMRRSYEGINYNSTVNVKVNDAEGNQKSDFTFDSTFNYKPKEVVGTIFRKVDEQGNSTFSEGSWDGKFGEGGNLEAVDWMIFDPKYKDDGSMDRILYCTNYYNGLWAFNITERNIKRLFPRSQYACMQTFTFTADGDTILIPDDNGNASDCNKPNMYYALRSEQFRKIHVYAYGPCTYSVVSMPNGTKFYGSWTNGAVYRQEPEGREIPFKDEDRTKCFTLAQISQIDGTHTRMIMHPDGKYVYIIAPQIHCILRSNYNARTNMLEYPTVVAGNFSQSGYAEGIGGSARFATLWCGIFVKNPEYEANPRSDGDEYDFYVTGNTNNDCIFKVTPDGVVTNVAGRSNQSKDGQTWGYVDGDPLNEARLQSPKGLAYDPTSEIFYFYDFDYHAMRYMAEE